MIFKLLYEGSSPPDAMPTEEIRDIDDDECATMYAAGREQDNNYSIIICADGVCKYWSPPAEPQTPDPEPAGLTKQQFLDLYAANSADLTATLAAWP